MASGTAALSAKAAIRAEGLPDALRQLKSMEDPNANFFLNATPNATAYHYIRATVVCLTLLPLRLIVLAAAALVGAGCASIALCGLTRDQERQPFVWWRRAFVAIVRVCARLLAWTGGVWWFRRTGVNLDPLARVVVANHVHILEGFYFVAAGYAPVLAAVPNRSTPLLSTMWRACQAIFVGGRREPGEPSASDAIVAHARNPRMPPLIVFPEGICGNGRVVITFRPGAFLPGLPVQPATTRLPYCFTDNTWPRRGGFGGLLLNSMLQVYVHCVVHALPTYTPSPVEAADAKAYARNVQALVARSLGVPTTASDSEDALLCLLSQTGGIGYGYRKDADDLLEGMAAFDGDHATALAAMNFFLQAASLGGSNRSGIDYAAFDDLFGGLVVDAPTRPTGKGPQGTRSSPGGIHHLRSLGFSVRSSRGLAATSSGSSAGAGSSSSTRHLPSSPDVHRRQEVLLRMLFAVLDADGDGRLTFPEFAAAWVAVSNRGEELASLGASVLPAASAAGAGARTPITKPTVAAARLLIDLAGGDDHGGRLTEAQMARVLAVAYPRIGAEAVAEMAAAAARLSERQPAAPGAAGAASPSDAGDPASPASAADVRVAVVPAGGVTTAAAAPASEGAVASATATAPAAAVPVDAGAAVVVAVAPPAATIPVPSAAGAAPAPAAGGNGAQAKPARIPLRACVSTGTQAWAESVLVKLEQPRRRQPKAPDAGAAADQVAVCTAEGVLAAIDAFNARVTATA